MPRKIRQVKLELKPELRLERHQMSRSTRQVNLRLKPELRDRLDQAAKSKGSSITREIVDRVESSLDEVPFDKQFDSDQTRGIISLFATLVRTVGPQAGWASTQSLDGAVNWFNDPYACGQVINAITFAAEVLLKPPANTSSNLIPNDPAEQALHSGMGHLSANRLLSEIVNFEALPHGVRAQRAEILRRHLGELADRLKANEVAVPAQPAQSDLMQMNLQIPARS